MHNIPKDNFLMHDIPEDNILMHNIHENSPSAPDFVSSLEDEEHVYFFFR